MQARGHRFSTQHNASIAFKTRTAQQQAEKAIHVRFFVQLQTKISRFAQKKLEKLSSKLLLMPHSPLLDFAALYASTQRSR